MTLAKKNLMMFFLSRERIEKVYKVKLTDNDVYKQMYSTDGSIYSVTPIGVTLPLKIQMMFQQ